VTRSGDSAGTGVDRSFWQVLGWAVYLGVSWTWCIGMFLPVLLMRDYGVWGFVAFAVPNVIGAAAMGWVLHRDGMSERLVERHRPAMIAFSAVTVAFHGFVLFSITLSSDRFAALAAASGTMQGVPLKTALMWATAAVVAGLAGVLIVMGRCRDRASQVLACGVFVLSLIAVGVWWSGEGQQVGLVDGLDPMGAAWFLAPSLLGFALCPYLDLTFHRARMMLGPAQARTAFSLGFGVFFFAMILFTLGYATTLLRPVDVMTTGMWVALIAVGVHFAAQLIATVQMHFREVDRQPKSEQRRAVLPLSFAAGVLLAVIAPQVVGLSAAHPSELMYRSFMVFYGLAFPAYVWIVMIPRRGDSREWSGIFGPDWAAGRRRRLVLAGVIGVALPMYWMGFMEGREPWLAAGVGVVLLGRLLAGKAEPVAD
jgi:hypothetical protein